ncbi:MAG: hypothetical protein U0269_02570 [Polyangiales bacterium]
MTVDAESWKSALTEARGGRALTKFRVDFDEDGTVRVHDLVTNERFSLSPSSASVGASANAAESAPAATVAPAVTAPAVSAPVAQTTATEATKASVPPPSKSSVVPPPGPTGRPSSAAMQAVVPPPPSRPSNAAFGPVAPAPQPPTVVATPAPQPSLQPATPPPVAQPTAPEPTAAAPQAPLELVVPAPGTLFFSRDREAAASNGLTYRERLIAVPPGTGAEQCTAVAREVWKQLRDSLASMPSGKFVSIAVFDHVFKSRPERPPIIVLGWKDWRGDEPDITVSRPSATSIAPPTTSIPPNSFAPPAPSQPSQPSQPSMAAVAQPVAQPALAAPAVPVAPVAPQAPPAEPVAAPVSLTAATVVDLSAASAVVVAAPPKHTVAFNELPTELAAQIAAAQSAQPTPPTQPAQPAQPAQPSAPAAQAPVAEPAPEPAPALLSAPVQPVPLVAHNAAIPLVAAPVVPVVAASPEAEPTAVTPMVVAPSQPPPAKPSQPPAKPPAPQPSLAAATQPSLAHAVPSASTSGPHGAVRGKKPTRHRGDDLLSEAFEALSDMAFLTDSPQAVDFAAQVAKDLLHTPFIVISLYDIDKHEIVIECCDSAPSAKGRRLKVAKGETRSDVMLRGLPVVSTRWEPDAYLTEAPIGPALFVSIALDRRLFGVIEIHREVGEHGFEHDEEGAASYIASQLAQFLADHSKRVGFREEPESSRRK